MSNRVFAPAGIAALVATGLLAPFAPAAAADEPMDHSMHQGHAGHQMTPEQIAFLKKKVPLYAGFTDEQINENMSRMVPDAAFYLSTPAVRDPIGVLGLGHGYAGNGNDQFKAGYAGVAAAHPTAVGLGMSMMGSAHIQEAVDQIEAAGARTIVVLPSETSATSSLFRQWRYIFGLTDDSGYLEVPRVRTKSKIIMATAPTRSPIIGRILGENLKTASRDPAKEAALLILHGPETPRENEEELRNLAKLAAVAKDVTAISEVFYGSLQDDAPAAVREANVKGLRDWITRARAAGKTVLVEPVLLTAGGRVSQKITRDLAGLDYTFVDLGMIGHPLFATWVQDTVAEKSRPGG
jgi:sirohydrochlorin ferrochelatase